jgi:anti-anti-sigma factor
MIETPEDSTPTSATGLGNPAPFRCDVSFADEHAVVAVRGELDLATAPELLREVQATIVLPLEGVTVDLRDVTFLDSSGIHSLLVGKSSAEERGVTFSLTSVPRRCRLVLEISGLAPHFGLDDA